MSVHFNTNRCPAWNWPAYSGQCTGQVLRPGQCPPCRQPLIAGHWACEENTCTHIMTQDNIRINTTVSSYIQPIAWHQILSSAQSNLHFTPLQTCPLQYQLISLGSIQPCCNYCIKTIQLHIYPMLCIARYSFIIHLIAGGTATMLAEWFWNNTCHPKNLPTYN